MIDIVERELRKFSVNITRDQTVALSRYCEELVRWNKKMNLTGLTGAAMVRRLVAEPAWVAQQLNMSGILIDIGSGNGSPAIPFHVLSKMSETHLVESRAKRAAFLRHVATTLMLSGVTVHRSRFEELSGDAIRKSQWVTLQAVSPSPQFIESIRQIAGTTTTVVWITSSSSQPPIKPTQVLHVPLTGTKVFLFDLDQS